MPIRASVRSRWEPLALSGISCVHLRNPYRLWLFGSANFLAPPVVGMFATTLWLLYVQAFILHAFCDFCLLSAALTTSISVIVVIAYFRERKVPGCWRTLILHSFIAIQKYATLSSFCNHRCRLVDNGRGRSAPFPLEIARTNQDRDWRARCRAGALRGGESARVTLEEFGDFQCPPCGILATTLLKVER